MATGGEKGNPKQNASPNTEYALKSTGGGGQSSIVSKGGERGLVGGPQREYSEKSVGEKRYDLTDRSLNRGSRK